MISFCSLHSDGIKRYLRHSRWNVQLILTMYQFVVLGGNFCRTNEPKAWQSSTVSTCHSLLSAIMNVDHRHADPNFFDCMANVTHFSECTWLLMYQPTHCRTKSSIRPQLFLGSGVQAHLFNFANCLPCSQRQSLDG